MRKTAMIVTVTTGVLGVFGAFLRWLQNTGAYDKATGCIVPNHPTTIVFLIYCLGAAALIFLITLAWLRRYDRDKTAPVALRSATPVPAVLSWVLGIGFALAGFLTMFSAQPGQYAVTQRLLGAAGILAGLCFPFLPGRRDGSAHALGRAAATVLTLFCCYWLTCSWRVHMEDPVIWGFILEILAIAATTVAFYYIAAYHFAAARPDRALLAVQLAVFLDLTTLFDARSTTQNAMLLLCTGMLLMLEVLLVENLWEKRS